MKFIRLQLFTILLVLTLHAAVDPFVGVWKLDSRKSKFTIGDPSFMFATIQVETTANGLKSTASAANGEGFASDFTFTCSLDGTPCPVISALPMRGSSAIDTLTLKRIDERTITARGTKDGKLVFVDQRAVSSDGMTMTVTRQGTTPDGRKYDSTIVLVRSR